LKIKRVYGPGVELHAAGGDRVMNCLKCGIPFSEDEVSMIKEDEADPICDSCDYSGDIYLITYNNEEFAVQAQNQEEALKKWKNYVQWMELAVPNEKPSVKKVKYFLQSD